METVEYRFKGQIRKLKIQKLTDYLETGSKPTGHMKNRRDKANSENIPIATQPGEFSRWQLGKKRKLRRNEPDKLLEENRTEGRTKKLRQVLTSRK